MSTDPLQICWPKGHDDDDKRFEGKPLPRQLIVSGCPGSGKSYILEQAAMKAGLSREEIARSTFHSDLSYGEFVGSYKPVPVWVRTETAGDHRTVNAAGCDVDVPGIGKAGKGVVVAPHVVYEYRPGRFIKSYVEAILDESRPHVLIIEEINRANPAHVFGDILQLMDRNASGDGVYEVAPSPDLDVYLKGVLKDKYSGTIRLPANLYIWATMNRADESVNYIDSAFMRRWSLRFLSHKKPCSYSNAKIKVGKSEQSWEEFRGAINDAIEARYDYVEEDKYIGPYFLTEDEMRDQDKVFAKLVLYLWHDVIPMERKDFFTEPTLSKLRDRWMLDGRIFKDE